METPPFSEIKSGERENMSYEALEFSEREQLSPNDLKRQAEDFLLAKARDKFGVVNGDSFTWAADNFPRQFCEYVKGTPQTDERYPAPPSGDDKTAEQKLLDAVENFMEKHNVDFDTASAEIKERNPSLHDAYVTESTKEA